MTPSSYGGQGLSLFLMGRTEKRKEVSWRREYNLMTTQPNTGEKIEKEAMAISVIIDGKTKKGAPNYPGEKIFLGGGGFLV